ncbi:MAG: sodium/proline symporter [Oscillospiraceae bacterium]|nr:sodium/proline symporter [Oscillospiraceae bacterium]
MNLGVLLAFIIYFVMMLLIGFHFFRRSTGNDDTQYFLGGRSMGPWVTAMSAQASDMSGWLLMGFPGSLIAFGMGQIWIGIGLALGTIANWLIVAKRLRRFSKASGDAITLPQYLTNRFASQSPALKIVCAVIFLISFTVYVASAFVAGETVLCSVVPWFADGHQSIALLVFAAIILLYTFLGGFKAVCWTDFIQGLLMLAALLVVPIVMAVTGDFDKSFYGAFADRVTAFNTNPFTADWTDIVTGLAWGLGYFGMPHILVRFMAIKKPSMMKKSAVVAIIWVILTLGAAAAVAILGRTYILSNGTAMAEALLPDARKSVFIAAVTDIFPGFLAGILLAAIVAAAMSTADSQLLVASSSFTSDLYKPLIRGNKASAKELGWIGRVVVAVIAVVAYLIASSGSEWASDIMAMVENAWGLFGAAFGPVIILSLFWKRFNYAGAVTGIIAGAAVDIVWLLFLTSKTNIYEILPGFVVGLIAAVAATLATKAPSAEVEKIFAEATAADIDD